MRIVSHTQTSIGSVICALVSASHDPLLVRQFLEARTQIWTESYPQLIKRLVEARDKMLTGEQQDMLSMPGFEYDHRDRISKYLVYFFVNNDGEQIVVGGCRLIYANGSEELPIQAYLPYEIPTPAVEISRFFIGTQSSQLLPDDSVSLLADFATGMATILRDEGYRCAYATIRKALFDKLTRVIPFPLLCIGPIQEHDAKRFVPSKFIF